MLWNIVLAALALAVAAAYVCRVDHTLWTREPVLHAVNVAGGISAVWVLIEAGQGRAAAGEAVILAAALAALLATYRHVPKASQTQQVPAQGTRRKLQAEELRRVAGGADKR